MTHFNTIITYVDRLRAFYHFIYFFPKSTTKRTKNTAIDDIVKKAGVAKGTFYLYFKDKYDIMNKIILKKTSAICKEAVDEVEKANLDTLEDRFIFFLEYLISYFKMILQIGDTFHRHFRCLIRNLYLL